MAETKKHGCFKVAGYGLLGLVGLTVISAIASPPSDKPAPPSTTSGAPKPESKPTPTKAQLEAAADRKAGFHCLSKWDGAHRGIVDKLKETLREPDSFEHIETRITPVNDKGMHGLMMRYRARNGFGGMNVGSLLASVKNSDCSFEIISNADG